MLPACSDDEFGILPPAAEPYRATLAEVRARFVDEAPEDQRYKRGLIATVLEVHLAVIRSLFKDHHPVIWLNGGFTTHKRWKAPSDADIAVLVPAGAYQRALIDRARPLWTLSNVTAQLGDGGPIVVTDALHTGLGLTDAYVINADVPAQVETWRRTWSRVSGPDGNIVNGMRKGFVEVIG
ncbi:DUF6932 family protein [Mycolicibacterium brisbanense]